MGGSAAPDRGSGLRILIDFNWLLVGFNKVLLGVNTVLMGFSKVHKVLIRFV